jgi:hypothetical protein
MIHSMRGSIGEARGYGSNGLELTVYVVFDAKEFNKTKKKTDPLSQVMGQIKNVVYDSTGIRSIPGYSPVSYNQRYPRSSKGFITLKLSFVVSEFNYKRLGIESQRSFYGFHKSIDLQSVFESTRNDGHLFAKTALQDAIRGAK